ncbi:hypothetical protein NAT51_04210 [Flavobacterium amniphilum]|uniref:hypothetical protein n=1 Tax=Flavobacterium amniphilum TaxID=1834035 RepID=UPI00202A37AE|nr:hypothetical protein [Flavobacterium amniphilum]MCL9804712.1 hypothetical protein [Flavobacterium amniphilum]
MKKFVILASLISVVACKKNEETKDEPGIMDAVENVQNLNNAAEGLKDFEKRVEELKKMTPVSSEIYKSVLTEEIGGLKRTNYSAGSTSMMGVSSAEATYGDTANKNIKLVILDGAGESGSAIISLLVMGLSVDTESIDGTNTKKSEEIDGVKYLTENDTNPDNPRSSITFIHDERFQVTLSGEKISLDELKTFLKKLDLSKLN